MGEAVTALLAFLAFAWVWRQVLERVDCEIRIRRTWPNVKRRIEELERKRN